MIESPAPKTELRRAQADTWVYFDSAIRRYGDAHVGLLTHALHYGTGCFEGIRAYWSERQQRLNVFRMADHFQRMTANARMLHMQLPHSVEALCDITVELLRRNAFTTDVYVRPLCYKSTEEIGIHHGGKYVSYFGTLFIFSLVGLVVNLISDLAYMWIDPRIDFEAREV